MSQSHQLAAIMFSDIVGYAAMMGMDEQRAFELLEKNRALQKPIVQECNGRWIKEFGDGVLISFNSVSDAVSAALRIQSECNREGGFQLRIGIHLGEVVFENNDVFGDGVNIASRLQAIAPPGGIYISKSVERNIKNKKDIKIIYVRKSRFKNIKEAEHVYQIIQEGSPPIGRGSNQPPFNDRKRRSRILTFAIIPLLLAIGYLIYTGPLQRVIQGWSDVSKSIAVLPLKVIGNDEEGKYFAEGVADVLTNHLHGVHNLKVRSRTSVEKYIGSAKTIPEIARELDVQYVLEGSVQKYQDDVRIIVQLINPESDDHIWFKEYNEKYEDIFKIQSEIALNVVSELNVKLAGTQKRRIESAPTKSTEAWDLYLRGREYHRSWWKFHELTDIEFAIGLYKRAIKKDSAFALAYTWLANALWDSRESDEQVQGADSLLRYLEKSIQLDPDLPDNYAALAKYQANELRDFAGATRYIEKAIQLDPDHQAYLMIKGRIAAVQRNHTGALTEYMEALKKEPRDAYPVLLASISLSYISVGEFDLAGSFIEEALKLSPDDLNFLHFLGHLRMITGRYEEYLQVTNTSLSVRSDNIGLKDRAKAFLLMENYQKAAEVYAQFFALPREKTMFHGFEKTMYAVALRKLGREQEALQMIAEARQWIDEHPFNAAYEMAKVHALLGETRKAIDQLNQWKPDLGIHAWIDKDPSFESLKDNPEFRALVQKFTAEIEEIHDQVRLKIRAGELPTLSDIM